MHAALLSHEMNEISPFVTKRMDPESTKLSEISQRKILYDFICMWNLKTLNSKKQNRMVVARG